MKYYIVLDTNVIVSALISKNKEAPTVLLLDEVIVNSDISLLVNEDILKEYHDVLHRPKFNLDFDFVDFLLDKLTSIAIQVKRSHFTGKLPDPKDAMFIEVSLSVRDSKIVTGNIKHFPGITNAMTPAEFLRLLKG